MMFAWRRHLSESATSFYPLKALLSLPKSLGLRFNQTFAEGGLVGRFDLHSLVATGKEMSGWKKLDATKLGIKLSTIPESPRAVLRLLRKEGFEAYLVGGCVRDLLLNKVPKDYDVVTTANLQQIRKKFHHARIIGRRFPICKVSMKGSVVEVSSIETVAKGVKRKEGNISQMSRGHVNMDLIRWKDCIRRDFTVNGLFFDPFAFEIYDYCDGIMDLTSLKLRTLIPAQLSFKEDCARILRGLRIAARLGLSFSKDTETAMHNLSASVKDLDKVRLMMEMNYMLSYGAAAASLSLLQRFNLLEILLPFQAAYLTQPCTNRPAQDSKMLMELFFNLDKVVACDKPCTCSLWIGLLAFHVALVVDPQDTLVVWTFCSVLYHGKWTEAVKVARRRAKEHASFIPEILKAFTDVSDEELALRVSKLASRVQDSIDTLSKLDCLLEAMARYPDSKCSRLVFVSKKAGHTAAQIFDVLVENNIQGRMKKRECFEINSRLLGEGHMAETRFALGKIIMDTLSSGAIQGGMEVDNVETEPCEVEESRSLAPAGLEVKEEPMVKGKARMPSLPEAELQLRGMKKQKLNKETYRIVQGWDVEEPKRVAVDLLDVVEKHIRSEQKTAKKDAAASRKDDKERSVHEMNRKLAKQKMSRRDSYEEENVDKKDDKGEAAKGIESKPLTCMEKHAQKKIANEEKQNKGMSHASQKQRKDVMVEEPAGEVSRRPRLSSLFR